MPSPFLRLPLHVSRYLTPIMTLVFLGFSPCAHAGVQWTGRTLSEICARSGSAGPRSECVVYVRAMIDRYHESLAEHCPRTEASFQEIMRSVLAYLAGHPSELDESAPQLVVKALMQRYGCG